MTRSVRDAIRPAAARLRPARRVGHTGLEDPFGGRTSRSRRRRDVDARTATFVLSALVLAALVARLAVDRSIWLDEAISIYQAKLPLGALIDDLQLSDRHPPLHHLVLWATIRLLGDAELAVRLPSIVFGTLAVPAAYLLARELYDRRCGLVAAALIAASPLLVWYSQEARGYALVAPLVLVSTWAQVRALRVGELRHWAIYALSASALVWTHYATLFVVGAQQLGFLVALVRRRREGTLRPLLVGFGASAVFLAWQCIPLMLFAARQFESTAAGATFGGGAQFSAAGEAGLSFYAVLANGAWALWGYHPAGATELLAATWPLLLLVALSLLGRVRSVRGVYLLTLVATPVLGLALVGLLNRDLFEVRYFIAAVPLALVLLARALTSWALPGGVRVAVTGAVIGSFCLGLADQRLNDDNPRLYDYRAALAQASAAARPGDVVLYEPPDLRYVLDYYAPRLRARPLADGTPSGREARRATVVASFQDLPRFRDRTNRLVGALRYERPQTGTLALSQVSVWSFGEVRRRRAGAS